MTWVFLLIPRHDWCVPLSHPSSCMLVNHGPSEQSYKEEYKPLKWGATTRYCASHTKTMLRQGSPCQDPAGNRTTRRPPDLGNGMHTAVLWSCLTFIRSGQNHLARHSERERRTRQTEEDVGRLHQKMDRSRVRQLLKGSGEQEKMEEIGCWIICGAPTTLGVKG